MMEEGGGGTFPRPEAVEEDGGGIFPRPEAVPQAPRGGDRGVDLAAGDRGVDRGGVCLKFRIKLKYGGRGKTVQLLNFLV